MVVLGGMIVVLGANFCTNTGGFLQEIEWIFSVRPKKL